MSGGVDSSVTACLLMQQGYEVIGIHLRFWVDPIAPIENTADPFPENKCCTLEGLAKTRKMADKLGIPFYVLNFEEPFKEKIVDYFIEGYKSGITPNPCVECNRNIKFGLLLEKMNELGAKYIATGHYARITKDPDGILKLHAAKDKTKDQSYFLYTLTQEKLKHILFPIGEYEKTQVREMAKNFGIDEMNNQKESQNLCFFPEKTQGPFLKRHLPKTAFKPGQILTSKGEIIGHHTGLPNYTIGQRKGLGIGGMKGFEHMEGKGWYVTGLDKTKNAVIVGPENELYSEKLTVGDLSFVSGNAPAGALQIEAKIRSRSFRQPAVLTINKKAEVHFTRPQRAITPGQSVVFYDGDTVIGGGIIKPE